MIRNASEVTKARKRLEEIHTVDRLEKRFFDLEEKKLTHVRLPSCTYILTSAVFAMTLRYLWPETEVIREKTNAFNYIVNDCD